MDNTELKLIREIDFRDVKVGVYYHPNNKNNLDGGDCCWQMSNPDSCYQGYMYVDLTNGKTTYPENAIIPEQTDKDREMLPKFIVVGRKEIDADWEKSIKIYLESEYLRRNKNG